VPHPISTHAGETLLRSSRPNDTREATQQPIAGGDPGPDKAPGPPGDPPFKRTTGGDRSRHSADGPPAGTVVMGGANRRGDAPTKATQRAGGSLRPVS
jgi:hypothetical protein